MLENDETSTEEAPEVCDCAHCCGGGLWCYKKWPERAAQEDAELAAATGDDDADPGDDTLADDDAVVDAGARDGDGQDLRFMAGGLRFVNSSEEEVNS